MKKHAYAAAITVALASMLSMPAHSQDRHEEHGRMHEDHGHGPDHRDYRGDRDDRDHRDYRAERGEHGEHGEWRHRDWHRGERVPAEYRNRQYVVEDWRGHRLNRPPRGYQWVQVPGGDYALISMGSGIIANIVIGH
jgi:Ni/Co efflux regulator RcnB